MKRGMLWWIAASVILLAAVDQPLFAQEPARLLLLSPSDDEEGQELPVDVLIAISLIDPDGQIDLASLRLYVDEKDVTQRATVTSAVITYVPDPPLRPGLHHFELRLKNTQGRDLPGLRRDIRVEGWIEEEPAWRAEGRIILETNTDNLSGPGSRLRQEPDQTNKARIRLGGHMGEWDYQGTLFLTSDEDKSYQPRNRYKFHLDHGWIGVDMGDVNYTFSPMVLRGKRTRGVGGYVRLGAVEMTALRGTVRRGIEGEVQADSTTEEVSITGATFERNLIGARLALGSGRTFQLAVDGVRVRDDIGSIPAGFLPKDNIVLGSNFILAPFKRRLILEASAAMSFITEDISGGAISEEEIRDLVEDANVPFNPADYEDIFIANLNTRPLNPFDLSSLALRGGVKGNLLGHAFEGRFQQVGASFASLAAPSIQSDKRGFRLTDAFRPFTRRVRVSGELERFKDNLSDDKDFTTETRISGVTASFLPDWLGFQRVTLSYRVYARDNNAPGPTASDSTDLRVDDQTTIVRIGTGSGFHWFQDHQVSASYMSSDTDALNPSADASQTDWTFGWTTRFDGLPLVLELGIGVNDTDYPSAGTQVKYNTRRLRGTYEFLDGRLETHASISTVSGDSNQGVVGGDKRTYDTGARLRLAERTFLSGRLALVDFVDDLDPDNNYEETVLNLRLAQNF